LGEVPQEFARQVRGESLAGLLLAPQQAARLPSERLLRRPDIRAQEARLLAANANIGAARAALFPSLSLTGSAGYSGEALQQLVSGNSLASSLGASLLQPIFRGGALKGAVDVSEERYVELVSAYRLSVLSALKEVEDALIALR